MRPIVVVTLMLLLSGCSDVSNAVLLRKIINTQSMEKPKELLEKRMLEKADPEKKAFLLAFSKLGFDMFEVAKLMKPGDERNIKNFFLRNRKRLLMNGTYWEIVGGGVIGTNRIDIIRKLIMHLELDYKFYLSNLK